MSERVFGVAEKLEKDGGEAAALTAWLQAQDLNPASPACGAAIKRLAGSLAQGAPAKATAAAPTPPAAGAAGARLVESFHLASSPTPVALAFDAEGLVRAGRMPVALREVEPGSAESLADALSGCSAAVLLSIEEERAETIVARATAFAEAARAHRVGLALEVLGRRPAGRTATPRLLQAAERALAEVGERPQWLPGSTDASAAIERGIPALGFGVYRGGGAHTPGEWVLPSSLLEGQRALLALLRGLGVG